MAAVARFLADTSALARLPHPAVDKRLSPLIEAGLVATCGVVELEVRRTARTSKEYDAVAARRTVAYEWLPCNDSEWQRALDVQQELARRGRLRGVKLPDLLVASTAERHDVVVLHYDHDFDLIAGVTGQPVEWIVPRGRASYRRSPTVDTR
jgi:predicted nucleic acid-binding protein